MKKFIQIFLFLSISLFLALSFSKLGEISGIVYAQEDGDEVIIPVEDGFLEEIFGPDGIVLNIMKPLNFWDNNGTASIFSILIFVYSFLTGIMFIIFIFSVLIGAIKWISSGGDEAKVQAARKWITNAVIGVVVIIIVFVVINVITYILGVGNIFDLAQNLSVCGTGADAESLIDYRRRTDDWDSEDCVCGAGGWTCSVSVPEPSPELEDPI